jgi:hypothetical protein
MGMNHAWPRSHPARFRCWFVARSSHSRIRVQLARLVVLTGALLITSEGAASLREVPTTPPPKVSGETGAAPQRVVAKGEMARTRLEAMANAQMARLGVESPTHSEVTPEWVRAPFFKHAELRQDNEASPAVFAEIDPPLPLITIGERTWDFDGRSYTLRLASTGLTASGEKVAFLIAETEVPEGKRLAGFLLRYGEDGGSFRFLPQGKWARTQSCFFRT